MKTFKQFIDSGFGSNKLNESNRAFNLGWHQGYQNKPVESKHPDYIHGHAVGSAWKKQEDKKPVNEAVLVKLSEEVAIPLFEKHSDDFDHVGSSSAHKVVGQQQSVHHTYAPPGHGLGRPGDAAKKYPHSIVAAIHYSRQNKVEYHHFYHHDKNKLAALRGELESEPGNHNMDVHHAS